MSNSCECNGTPFSAVYNRFLGKITDDMYMELTPEDTVRDLQRLLIDALPGFEFPRKDIYDYTINLVEMNEEDVRKNDFILGVSWGEIPTDDFQSPQVLVDKSYFEYCLTTEEINIIALLMMNSWLQRQVTSIENIRMKYSGSDFKFTSQANHLSKLLSLQAETQRQSFHMQRLYKRRKKDSNGNYQSTWSMFRNGTKNTTWVNKTEKIQAEAEDTCKDYCDCDFDSYSPHSKVQNDADDRVTFSSDYPDKRDNPFTEEIENDGWFN